MTLIPQGKTIALFSAKWCSHCKNMKSEWNSFKSKLEESRKDVTVVTIDSEELKKSELSVNGFPTIYAFNNGEKVDEFENSRTASNFMKFTNQVFPNQSGGGRNTKKSKRQQKLRRNKVNSKKKQQCRNKSRMRGGGYGAPVDAPSTIQPSLQWNSPHTKVPPPAYNGGLYGGEPFAGPWGTVPVPATTSYHINKNLVSAEPPPLATTHYPGTERLGNNYTGMPGINWYAKDGLGPYNMQCVTGNQHSGGGGSSQTLNTLIKNAEHISKNLDKTSVSNFSRRNKKQSGGGR